MPLFMAPWLLLAGLAAGVPLVLHLMNRRNPKLIEFSWFGFLQQAEAKTKRSRRLMRLFTLLLRMLIILLLACAFAQPRIRTGSWLPGGNRQVIIVLDASASMRYKQGGETAFEEARAWSLRLISGLRENDRVGLVVAGMPDPARIMPPVSNHDRVVEEIEATEPAYAAVDLVTVLINLMEDTATTARSDTEFHVFSDFQRSGWDTERAQNIGEVTRNGMYHLFFNQVAPDKPRNAGIVDVQPSPPALIGDGKLSILTSVEYTSDDQAGSTLTLHLNGNEVRQTALPRGDGSTVKHEMRGISPASATAEHIQGRLTLDADAFAPDDVRRFSMRRITRVPVLLVGGGADSVRSRRDTTFLRLAIDPSRKGRSVFMVETVGWQELARKDLQAYRAVFISNPPTLDRTMVEKLEQYAEKGGTLVIFPGEHKAIREGVTRFSFLSSLGLKEKRLTEEREVQLLHARNPGALEKQVTAALPKPVTLSVRRRLVFQKIPEGASGVFMYPDDTPFFLKIPLGGHGGRCYLGSVTANRDWSDWPLHPSFVLLQQALVQRASRVRAAPASIEVGQVYPLAAAGPERNLDLTIEDPAGNVSKVTVTRARPDNPFALDGFRQPGMYKVAWADMRRTVAVNTPAQESRLLYRRRSALSMAGSESVSVHHSASWEQQQALMASLLRGRPLWPLLLIAAFFLALIEPCAANIRRWPGYIPQGLRLILRGESKARS